MNLSQSLSSPKTSITARVEVENRDAFLYCGAFKNDSAKRPSMTDVLFQGFASYTVDLVGEVTISGLVPYTGYNVYCLTKSLRGVFMTTSAMLETQTFIKTACCKSISVDIITLYAYADSVSLSGLVVALDAPPSSGLTIHLSTFNNVSSSNATVAYMYPSSLYFSSDSESYESSVNWLAVSLGTYKVNVTLTGPSASEYLVSFVNNATYVHVLSLESEPRVPAVISSAPFSSDGGYITLSFDASTDRAGNSGSFPCSSLLGFADSLSATCSWSSPSAIVIYTSSTTTLSVGGHITVRGHKVQAACIASNCSDWAYVLEANATVVAPTNLASPSVYIAAPSTKGVCDSFALDMSSSTGSGGRAWASVNVSVASASNTSRLGALLRSDNYVDDPPTIIDESYFSSGGSYAFTITLCNFLGACAVGSHSLVVSSTAGLFPKVSIAGAPVRSVKSDAVSLSTSAYVMHCDGSISYVGLSYNWTVADSSGDVVEGTDNLSKDSSKFALADFALSRYKFYIVTVTAWYSDFSSSYSVTLYIEPSSTKAVISGASERVVRYKRGMLAIDASSSFDAHVDASVDLNVTWLCYQISPVFSVNCSVSFVTSTKHSKVLYVYTNNNDSIGSVSRITAAASDSFTSSTAYVDVTVVDVTSPVISIDTTSVTHVDLSRKYVLTGTVTTNESACTALWSISDSAVSLDDDSLVPISYNVAAGSSRIVSLVLKAYSLSAKSSYTFSLSCTNPAAVASVVVATNDPPLPGLFSVSPLSGRELETSFLHQASLWRDVDLPLEYEFGYLFPADPSTALAVQSKSADTNGFSLLPSGLAGDGYNVTCYVKVYDSYGAETLSSHIVKVSLSSQLQAVASFSSWAASALKNATPNADALLEVISIAGTVLSRPNCTLSYNCSALHRSDCSTTSFTCGSCLTGYIGNYGHSNSQCYLESAAAALALSSSPPPKACASPSCFSRGTCEYYNLATGKAVSMCYVTDTSCDARCNCIATYGGSSCSLDLADVLAAQEVRALLVSQISSLLDTSDLSQESLLVLSSLLVQVLSDPYEVSEATCLSALAVLHSIMQGLRALDYDYTADAVVNVLAASDDALAALALVPPSSRRRLSQALQGHFESTAGGVFLTLMDEYSALVSSQMYPGQAAAEIVFASYRTTIELQELPQSVAKYNITARVPATKFEVIQGADRSSLLLPIPDSYPIYSFVAISVTQALGVLFDDYSDNMTSNAVRMMLFDASRVLPLSFNSTVHLAYSHDVNYTVSVSPYSFSSKCKFNVPMFHSYLCPDTGFVVSHNCTGESSVILTSTCPSVQQIGMCASHSTAVSCSLSHFTNTYVECDCRLATSRRRLSSSDDSQLSVDLMGAFAGTATGVGSTLETSYPDFSDATESDSTVFIVLAAYAVAWAAGTLMLLATRFARAKALSKVSSDKEQGRAPRKTSSAAAARERFFDYVVSTFPVVFRQNRSIRGRISAELVKHHYFYNLLVTSITHAQEATRMAATLQLLSFQSSMIFLLAVFYDMQTPSDDGSCDALRSEAACQAKTGLLDASQEYCSWSPDSSTCAYNDAYFSWSTLIFISAFVSVSAVAVMCPLDLLFAVINAPSAEPSTYTDPQTRKKRLLEESLASRARHQKVAPDRSHRLALVNSAHLYTHDKNSLASASHRVLDADIITSKARMSMSFDEERVAAFLSSDLQRRSGSGSKKHRTLGAEEKEDRESESDVDLNPDSYRWSEKEEALRLGFKVSDVAPVSRQAVARDGPHVVAKVIPVGHRSVHMALFLHDLCQQRRALAREDPSCLYDFDSSWGINAELSSDKEVDFINQLISSRRCFDRAQQEAIDSIIYKEIQRVDQEFFVTSQRLKKAGDDEVGFEVIHAFIDDLLGRESVAAKVFRSKAKEDYTRLRTTGWGAKTAAWSLVFLANMFFLYFIIARASQKGYNWQMGLLVASLVQLFLEIFLKETAFVLWRHCLVPSLVAADVKRASDTIYSNLQSLFHGVKYQETSPAISRAEILDAPAYLFVSRRLAERFSYLPESMMVSHYHSHLPGPLAKRWAHLGNTGNDVRVVSAPSVASRAVGTATSLVLAIGTSSSILQRFVTVCLVQVIVVFYSRFLDNKWVIVGSSAALAALVIVVARRVFREHDVSPLHLSEARRSLKVRHTPVSDDGSGDGKVAISLGSNSYSDSDPYSQDEIDVSCSSTDDEPYPLYTIRIADAVPPSIDPFEWLDEVQRKKKSPLRRRARRGSIDAEESKESIPLEAGSALSSSEGSYSLFSQEEEEEEEGGEEYESDARSDSNGSAASEQDDYLDASDDSSEAAAPREQAAVRSQQLPSGRTKIARGSADSTFTAPKMTPAMATLYDSTSSAGRVVKVVEALVPPPADSYTPEEEVAVVPAPAETSSFPITSSSYAANPNPLLPVDPTDWLERVVSVPSKEPLAKPVLYSARPTQEEEQGPLGWLHDLRGAQRKRKAAAAGKRVVRTQARDQVHSHIMQQYTSSDAYTSFRGAQKATPVEISATIAESADSGDDYSETESGSSGDDEINESASGRDSSGSNSSIDGDDQQVAAAPVVSIHGPPAVAVAPVERAKDPLAWLQKAVVIPKVQAAPIQQPSALYMSPVTSRPPTGSQVEQSPLEWLKSAADKKKALIAEQEQREHAERQRVMQLEREAVERQRKAEEERQRQDQKNLLMDRLMRANSVKTSATAVRSPAPLMDRRMHSGSDSGSVRYSDSDESVET